MSYGASPIQLLLQPVPIQSFALCVNLADCYFEQATLPSIAVVDLGQHHYHTGSQLAQIVCVQCCNH